jgi:hypothetical protein
LAELNRCYFGQTSVKIQNDHSCLNSRVKEMRR